VSISVMDMAKSIMSFIYKSYQILAGQSRAASTALSIVLVTGKISLRMPPWSQDEGLIGSHIFYVLKVF
jgi:hypothetical protein